MGLFFKKYVFIWLRQVLVVVHGFASCGEGAPERTGSVVAVHRLSCSNMWDFSSLTRNRHVESQFPD